MRLILFVIPVEEPNEHRKLQRSDLVIAEFREETVNLKLGRRKRKPNGFVQFRASNEEGRMVKVREWF